MSVRFGSAGASNITRTNAMPNFSPFTFCAWVKISVDTDYYAQVMYMAGPIETFFAAQNDGVTMELFYGSGLAMLALTVGTWYFVAFSLDAGASSVDVYYAAAGATSLSTASMVTVPFGAATALTIGDDVYAEPWNGLISKARAWQARLTGAELLIEFKSPAPVRQTNLVDYVPLRSGPSAAGATVGTWAITGTLGTDGEPPPDAVSAGALMAA